MIPCESIYLRNSRETVIASVIGAASLLDGIKHSTPIHSRRRSHDKKKATLFCNDDNNDRDKMSRHVHQKSSSSSLERRNDQNEKNTPRRETLESSGSFIEDLRRKKEEEQAVKGKEKEAENLSHLQPNGLDVLSLDDFDTPADSVVSSIRETTATSIATNIQSSSNRSAKYHGDNEVSERTTLQTVLQTSSLSNRSAKYHDSVTGITLETAVNLKTLIFGGAKSCFNAEWRRQGFYFSSHPALKYGLVQEKGGPCGLLASVQAWLLSYLLEGSSTSGGTSKDDLAFCKVYTRDGYILPF